MTGVLIRRNFVSSRMIGSKTATAVTPLGAAQPGEAGVEFGDGFGGRLLAREKGRGKRNQNDWIAAETLTAIAGLRFAAACADAPHSFRGLVKESYSMPSDSAFHPQLWSTGRRRKPDRCHRFPLARSEVQT